MMKKFKNLLALLLILSMCLSFASAAELTAATQGVVSVDTEETECAHDHSEEAVAAAITETDGSETTTADRMTWKLDSDGTLWIGGKGIIKAIASAEAQPWKDVRAQITEVRFESSSRLMIESIAYWFADCTNLVYAELSGSVFAVDADAFRNCAALEELLVYTREGTPDVASTAFSAVNGADLCVYVQNKEAQTAFENANWYGRSVEVIDFSIYPTSLLDGPCGISGCTCTTCSWHYEYEQYNETYHWRYAACDNCSATEALYASRMSHTFNSSGVCTGCGYVEETEEACTHGSTYNVWSGCSYDTYCNYCGEYLRSGTEHGSYTYGSWSYYSSSQHRRTATCSDCGDTSYQYASHSTKTKYTYVNTTTHSVSQYCSSCSSTIGSSSTEAHTYTYGDWRQYGAYQHCRTWNCVPCNYGGMDYYVHNDSTGDGLCDTCGYVLSVTVTWDAATNGGTVNGESSVTTTAATGAAATAPSYTPVKTGHTFKGWYTDSSDGALYSTVTISSAQTFYAQFTAATYTISFDPGEGSTETTTKTVTYGDSYGELPLPVRGGYNFDGWFTEETGGTQITADTPVDITANQTLYAQWTRLVSFSVTVPAALPIVVDEDGVAHTTAASIINNSTGDVKVSSVSLSALNNWSIAPYSMNTARQKVDANRIGFSIQDAQTTSSGSSETLAMPSAWQIAEGSSLALAYDAVITALSQPVSDLNVLSVIFILEWA